MCGAWRLFLLPPSKPPFSLFDTFSDSTLRLCDAFGEAMPILNLLAPPQEDPSLFLTSSLR